MFHKNLISENKIVDLQLQQKKSKIMAFSGKYPTRIKIMINNKIIEQVKIFNYLGNMVSYENKK